MFGLRFKNTFGRLERKKNVCKLNSFNFISFDFFGFQHLISGVSKSVKLEK